MDIIVREGGYPYTLTKLTKHLGIFKLCETHLANLKNEFNYMNYDKDSETLFIDDPDPQPVISGLSIGSGLSAAISSILTYVERGTMNYICLNNIYCISKILKDWKASDKLKKCFEDKFPYIIYSYWENPKTIILFDQNKSYTHWQVLCKAREKEKKYCKYCHLNVPWLRTLDSIDSEVCSCYLYYTDSLDRTDQNPYFDEDHADQREHDNNDALRRQND